jgi:hypothetical protein
MITGLVFSGGLPILPEEVEMENEQGTLNGNGSACIHYWLLDEKNYGVCKKCGEAKQFCSSWSTIQKAWYSRPNKANNVVPEVKS